MVSVFSQECPQAPGSRGRGFIAQPGADRKAKSFRGAAAVDGDFRQSVGVFIPESRTGRDIGGRV